ncbi:hypothetical protein B0H15DRAFT_60553 [Mycena belliarum]|uniref:Uncharacterized protein n=1 Tax=Mycena belliarum TaxID=1033014 RepID=A0AAD6XIR8_9AGAR|nr:hypothetical protein B0H15DRAFT_60553 [Mycena belliae]
MTSNPDADNEESLFTPPPSPTHEPPKFLPTLSPSSAPVEGIPSTLNVFPDWHSFMMDDSTARRISVSPAESVDAADSPNSVYQSEVAQPLNRALARTGVIHAATPQEGPRASHYHLHSVPRVPDHYNFDATALPPWPLYPGTSASHNAPRPVVPSRLPGPATRTCVPAPAGMLPAGAVLHRDLEVQGALAAVPRAFGDNGNNISNGAYWPPQTPYLPYVSTANFDTYSTLDWAATHPMVQPMPPVPVMPQYYAPYPEYARQNHPSRLLSVREGIYGAHSMVTGPRQSRLAEPLYSTHTGQGGFGQSAYYPSSIWPPIPPNYALDPSVHAAHAVPRPIRPLPSPIRRPSSVQGPTQQRSVPLPLPPIPSHAPYYTPDHSAPLPRNATPRAVPTPSQVPAQQRSAPTPKPRARVTAPRQSGSRISQSSLSTARRQSPATELHPTPSPIASTSTVPPASAARGKKRRRPTTPPVTPRLIPDCLKMTIELARPLHKNQPFVCKVVRQFDGSATECNEYIDGTGTEVQHHLVKKHGFPAETASRSKSSAFSGQIPCVWKEHTKEISMSGMGTHIANVHLRSSRYPCGYCETLHDDRAAYIDHFARDACRKYPGYEPAGEGLPLKRQRVEEIIDVDAEESA